jgi:hypothetical protein
MNNLLAVLKAGTAVVPPLKQDVGPDQRGIADLMQLAAKLSRQPQADPQTLRAVEARLTPVQKGELARLRDAAPADKSSSAPVTPSKSPSTLTQARLTPVQQGELAREIVASRTSGSTKSGGAPTSKPPVAFAGGELLNQRRALGFSIGGAFRDLGDKIGDGIRDGFDATVDFVEDEVLPVVVGGVVGGILPPGVGLIPIIVPPIVGGVIAIGTNPAVGDAIGMIIPTPIIQTLTKFAEAFKGDAEPLSGIVSGSNVDEFLSVAGAGTEWGEHLFALSKNPAAKTGFAVGFAKGIGEGIVGLGKSVGSIIQASGDVSLLGRVGDLIRDSDRTGPLAPAVDAILPSQLRGRETVQKIFKSVDNFAKYAESRIQDPQLLRDDVRNYMKDNWNNLKGEWQAANNAGSKAEGEFFGKIVGLAAFEIALEFVPGKAILTVLKATDKVIDFAQTVSKLPSSQTVKAADLPAYEKTLDDLNASADRVKIAGEVTDAELTQLQDSWTELNNIDPQSFGFGPEAERINGKIAETKADIETAVDTVYRLSTPARKKQRVEEQNAWLAGMKERVEARSYKPETDSNFSTVENKLRKISKNGAIELKSNEFIDNAQLAKVTKDHGHEYSLFEITRGGEKR